MRKHGWKSPETAMRYIKDTKIHARIMADKVAGTSVSTTPPGTASGPPPRQPPLMPTPTPSCKLCLGGSTEFNICNNKEFQREAMEDSPSVAEEAAIEIKDEKSGHRHYFNLTGAQNVTINVN